MTVWSLPSIVDNCCQRLTLYCRGRNSSRAGVQAGMHEVIAPKGCNRIVNNYPTHVSRGFPTDQISDQL